MSPVVHKKIENVSYSILGNVDNIGLTQFSSRSTMEVGFV